MTKPDKKTSIIKCYAKLAKQIKRHVQNEDLNSVGITRDMVSHHFGSLSNLEKIAREKHPGYFFDVTVESLHSPKALQDLRDIVKNKKKFVITTAVQGCEVHKDFYKSIKQYCQLNDAHLLVIVASDPAATHGGKWGTISAQLANETIIIEDTRLNSNVFISTIKLSAKHIDPTTGLGRIGQRNGTFIYASPKQRLKPVPVSNSKLPHFMMTTGAITVADYDTDKYMSQRTAYIAQHDHVMGAVVFEIEDDETYHFTQIQSDSKGHFIDRGYIYRSTGRSQVRPEAFVLGDWHSGVTDPLARRAWEEVSKEMKPKKIILHDAFDGLSINHHEEKNQLLKAKRSKLGQLSLENECINFCKDLIEMSDLCDELVIVKSNHDLFLARYLSEGKYTKDPQNHRISLILALKMLDGEDPLKAAVEIFVPINEQKKLNKIKFLKSEEDFKIEGIQCGAHGHQGPNGARGNIINMEVAYGNSVTGHAHSPEILRGAWQVGTSSLLKLEYNTGGASSWLHSSCLIWPGGTRQLINSINGKWRIK
jgi:hypothetical protein